MLAQRRAGLRSSPCGFGEDQLVERQIGGSLSERLIHLLQPFELVQLVSSHIAMLLAPLVIGLFGYAGFPDRVAPSNPLADKNLNLPQSHDNLFRIVPLASHL